MTTSRSRAAVTTTAKSIFATTSIAGLILLLQGIHCGSDSPAPAAAAAADGGGGDAATTAPTFCTTTAASSFFCADFDRGLTPALEFGAADLSGGGTATLIDATSTSKPKAVRLALPPIGAASTDRADAQLAKQFSLSNKKSAVVDFVMRIGDSKPSSDQVIRYFAFLIDTGSIGLFRDANKWFLTIHRDNSGSGADENDEPVIGSSLPLDTWIHVHVEIVFGRPGGSIRFAIDGEDKLSQAISTHGDAQPVSTGALVLGPSRAAGAIPTALALDFDDVTLQLP